MPDASIVQSIHKEFVAIIADLDERASWRWAAAEAISLGRGGVSAVSVATGISDRTIRNGIREIQNHERLEPGRQRRPGVGRKSRQLEQHRLVKALEKLIDSGTCGNPMSPLKWTLKSTRKLAAELRRQGFEASSTKFGDILKPNGNSLQSNRKSIEGKQHPDGNAQFEFIAKRARYQQRYEQLAISIVTKKKEVLGNLKNPGRNYQKSKNPAKVLTRDFLDKELG